MARVSDEILEIRQREISIEFENELNGGLSTTRFALVKKETKKQVIIYCPLCFRTHTHGRGKHKRSDFSHGIREWRVRHCATDEVEDPYKGVYNYLIVPEMPVGLDFQEYFRLPKSKDSSGITFLYRHFDENQNLLYVGISIDPGIRFRQHRHSSDFWSLVRFTTYEVYDSRSAAAEAEAAAIRAERPVYNVTYARAKQENVTLSDTFTEK